ncbi:hypothetical protein HRG_012082 [Hirsutella rhossiliensis]
MLGQGTEADSNVSLDEVVPLGVFDDTSLKQPIVIDSTFIFDGVLDVARLRNSLERLIEQDGWRKAGARLRLNKTGFTTFSIKWPEHIIP